MVQLGRNLAATQAYYYAHQGFPCHPMFQENSSQGSHMTAIELRKALPDHLRTKTAADLADMFRKQWEDTGGRGILYYLLYLQKCAQVRVCHVHMVRYARPTMHPLTITPTAVPPPIAPHHHHSTHPDTLLTDTSPAHDIRAISDPSSPHELLVLSGTALSSTQSFVTASTTLEAT